MRIGTVLNLEVKDTHTGQTAKYYCKIIEKNKKYFIIDYPTNAITKRTSFFPNGTFLTVTYSENEQAIYQFSSKIAAKVKLNVPALAIPVPKDEQIKRVQRREYVRVEATVDVAIHSENHSFQPFVTVTTDLSGGGMAIIAEKNTSLELGSTVDIWLSLQMPNNEYQYIYGQSEIVTSRELNYRINLISLKFISINNLDRQQIIRFCFEKQREVRKRELL